MILKYMRYTYPAIANANAMSKMSLKTGPNEPIYFHAAWLKPGRNSYVIE